MSANDKREDSPRTFLEFAEAKAALAQAVRVAASSGAEPDSPSAARNAKSAALAEAPSRAGSQTAINTSGVAWGLKSRREDKVKRLIDQLQVQRPSNEGRLPGGKSIPALPTSRDAWLPASRLKQDKI
jgi:hypothetical protein